MEKRTILQEVINFYTNGNKASFAKKLGVSPQSINTWITRNTFDIDLIYAKCERVSAEFLLTGKGEMLRQAATELDMNNNVRQLNNEDYKEKYFEVLEENRVLHNKYEALLEQKQKKALPDVPAVSLLTNPKSNTVVGVDI
ncbi:MAG: helix-turn-helix domain containing protein [Prevotellaceae bacterium]|jgi:hypothetical protein|nr:helix-turn-helix domain containing protein [Prevotellaceae bacterium]